MVRSLILTTILYNSGPTALFEFVVQCQEMYKDDVCAWGKTSNIPRKDWFVAYSMSFIGIPFDRIKSLRDIYVHDLDTNYDVLYYTLLGLTISDMSCLCSYFSVPFDADSVSRILNDAMNFVVSLLGYKENRGSKES